MANFEASGRMNTLTATTVKEVPVFQEALVAFLREQGVQTEEWLGIGCGVFLRNQPPPDDLVRHEQGRSKSTNPRPSPLVGQDGIIQ